MITPRPIRYLIAVCCFGSIGCEEPIKTAPLVTDPREDAGPEGGVEEIEPELTLYGKCVFDPNKVYVSGTLNPKDPSQTVLFAVDAPEDVCFWGEYTVAGFIRSTDGAFVYMASDGKVRTLVPDEAGENVGEGWEFPDAVQNDTFEQLPCLGTFYGTPEGKGVYTCSIADTVYTNDEAVPVGHVMAAGVDGLRLINNGGGMPISLVRKDGTSVPIKGLSVNAVGVIAARAHEDGFWLVVSSGADRERWFLNADGTANLEGLYDVYPDGIWAPTGKLDADGVLYVLSSAEGAIARVALEAGSSVIYSEKNAPIWAPVNLKSNPPKFYALVYMGVLFTGY